MYRKILMIMLIVMLLAAISGCSGEVDQAEQPLQPEPEEEIPVIAQPVIPEPVEITITAVGDVMTHAPQLEAHYYPQTGKYSFIDDYRFVTSYIREADLAIANLETTLPGEERGYHGRPTFRTPDAIADALKYAGFDVLVTANNHAYDSGREGFLRTNQVLKDKGLGIVGTRSSTEEPRFYLTDVKGIKVGITAFTYERVSQRGRKSINGHLLEEDMAPLINSYNSRTMKEDLDDMLGIVARMQEEGAEIIVFCLHWGIEYSHQLSDAQDFFTAPLIDAGVDVIFGSHPHVVQPMQIIYPEGNPEKQSVVFYSLGNFISDQRREHFGIPATEDGIIASVKFEKEFMDNSVTLLEVDYLPTWVHKYKEDGREHFDIIPVEAAIENAPFYGLTEIALQMARESGEHTRRILSSLEGR